MTALSLLGATTTAANSSAEVSDQLSSGVSEIFSTTDGFTALKDDGSVIKDVNQNGINGTLTSGVIQIVTTSNGNAALEERRFRHHLG